MPGVSSLGSWLLGDPCAAPATWIYRGGNVGRRGRVRGFGSAAGCGGVSRLPPSLWRKAGWRCPLPCAVRGSSPSVPASAVLRAGAGSRGAAGPRGLSPVHSQAPRLGLLRPGEPAQPAAGAEVCLRQRRWEKRVPGWKSQAWVASVRAEAGPGPEKGNGRWTLCTADAS